MRLRLQRHVLRLLAPLAALAIWPAHTAAGHENGSAPSTFRVYYAFDPAVADQVARAAATARLTAADPAAEWIGAVPGSPVAPSAPGTVGVDALLAAEGRVDPAVARWLRAPAATDRVLVVNRLTGAIAAGAGRDAARIAAAAGLGAGVATDVSITTWGKVKELFR